MRLSVFAVVVVFYAVGNTGCDPKKSLFQPNPSVKVQNLTVKLHWPSGSATLEALGQQQKDFQVNPDHLLKLVTEDKTPHAGMGPGDSPILVAVNKQTNDAKHWRLTDNVKSMRLRKEFFGVELKTVSQVPLRVEVWANHATEVELFVEMKE